MAEVQANDIPSWMSKEYFIDAVAQKLELKESEFEISALHVKLATESGDNFASKLYRVNIDVAIGDGPSRKVPLIVKALPSAGLTEEMIQMMNVFPKETEMYTKLLPQFEDLYREKEVKVCFGPRCLKSSTEPTAVLVLEDLNEREFRMANRREGLDRSHVDVFLKRLAQLHAASAVYHEKHGAYSDHFKEGMYAERSIAMFEAYGKPHMESLMKIIRKSWPDGEFYTGIMNDFGMSMFYELMRISKANPNGFNVLNHGDAWCNNFMFQYGAENDIEEITLVDFQMCVWSSPVIDLHYFIFTSINPAIRLSQLDNIISFYHRNLVDNLALLGYSKKPPTLKDLSLDFIDRMLYGYSSSFSVLSICLMEKTEDASIETMMSDGEVGENFREKMYANPAFLKQMEVLLPFFYDYGVFDIRHSGYQTPSGVFSDFLMLPGWMRKEFFYEVVEKKLGVERDQYSIERIWVEIATKKGDNYGSIMYRAKLDVENRVTKSLNKFSVIVKVRPTGLAADFSDKLDPFSKEIEMFTKIIPAFEEMYGEKGLQVEIGPRCLKVCQGVPSDVIVMEDLCEQGYRLGKKQEGVDQKHVESIVEKLAEFHAASAVYQERNGNYADSFKEGLYNKSNLPVMEYMFMPAYKAGLEVLKTLPFAKDYIDDLEKLQPVAFSRTLENTVVDPNGFNVLNHGDFWINNVMFQYDSEDQLKNSTILDFQMCFYGSPVLDLNYFLYTSVNLDIRLSKLTYFIRRYHEKLVSSLALLGYSKPLPTLMQLQFDFYDRMVYGSSNIFGILALICLDPSDDISMELMQQDSDAGREFRRRMYTNERYLKAMECLLPFFAERGAFKAEAEVCRFASKKT